MSVDKERYQGLEFLTTAVLLVQADGEVSFANLAAQALFDTSRRSLRGHALSHFFMDAPAFDALFSSMVAEPAVEQRQIFDVLRADGVVQPTHLTLSCPEDLGGLVVVELREIEQQLKFDREARLVDQSMASKELIRNLAHEIKNPLGGIRGAAQLLEGELHVADLKEYTQVIIQESDRLQSLVDRLLAPHRKPHQARLMNIHEVCERVRSLILAEYSKGLKIVRDYDISIPEFMADFEQLIQVLLNIVRNAAQALTQERAEGRAEIRIRTRVVRRVTLNRTLHRLALDLQVIDNGPGVAPEVADRIFFPLVSAREGGTGMGLTLAQTFVQQHGGMIECQSQAGKTVFKVLLPLQCSE